MASPSPTALVRAIIPDLPPDFVDRLQGAAEGAGRPLELLVAKTPEEATGMLRTESDISVLIDAVEMGAPTRWACTEDMLSAAQPSLKWVQSGQAGQDAAPLALYAAKGVVLTNAAVITGSHLAEHILALMLSFSRQLPLHFANQLDRKWTERSEYPPGELTGSTLLVVGLGGAGLGTCQRAKAFNMTVIATRRRLDPSGALPDGVDEVHAGDKDSLLAVLPRADYVAVCCPLTPETRNLFDKAAFAAMKTTAVIMSVGRGPIINTQDLVQALQSGEIGGAGLDVTDPQPLPPDHPLWRMKNVIITPHASGHSPLRAARMQELVLDNLRRFLGPGGTAALRNQVDTSAGY